MRGSSQRRQRQHRWLRGSRRQRSESLTLVSSSTCMFIFQQDAEAPSSEDLWRVVLSAALSSTREAQARQIRAGLGGRWEKKGEKRRRGAEPCRPREEPPALRAAAGARASGNGPRLVLVLRCLLVGLQLEHRLRHLVDELWVRRHVPGHGGDWLRRPVASWWPIAKMHLWVGHGHGDIVERSGALSVPYRFGRTVALGLCASACVVRVLAPGAPAGDKVPLLRVAPAAVGVPGAWRRRERSRGSGAENRWTCHLGGRSSLKPLAGGRCSV